MGALNPLAVYSKNLRVGKKKIQSTGRKIEMIVEALIIVGGW
jgi:hypothetical protein